MTTVPPAKPPGRPARRRTVRVVEPRVNWHLALATLVCVSLVAALLIGAWLLWRREPPVQARQRALWDIQMQWICEAGHEFSAPGQTQPRVCPVCGAPAEIVDTYACEVHGEFKVRVRLGLLPGADKPRVIALRAKEGDWVPVERGLKCPRCDRTLKRPPRDPLRHHRSD